MTSVTLLTARWCSICPNAKAFWRDLKASADFDYEEVDVESELGQQLVERHLISSMPTSIMDGRVILFGVPAQERVLQLLGRKPPSTDAFPWIFERMR